MATISRQYSMLSTSIDNIEQGLLQILTDTDIASLEGSLQHLREVQRSLDRTRQRIASGARAVFQSEADEANEAVIMPTLFDRTLLDRILRGSVDGHPSDLPNQPSHPTTLGEIESIEHLQRDANASSTVKHLISLCRAWTTAQEKLSYDGEVVTLNEATAM